MRASSSPRKALIALVGAATFAFSLSSCSDPVDDSVGRACKVIASCNRDISAGECIDLLGGEPPECTACIEESSCEDYSSCQREPVGCRIPPQLLPE